MTQYRNLRGQLHAITGPAVVDEGEFDRYFINGVEWEEDNFYSAFDSCKTLEAAAHFAVLKSICNADDECFEFVSTISNLSDWEKSLSLQDRVEIFQAFIRLRITELKDLEEFRKRGLRN